ncbi:ATP-binding protein [Tuwongella immobilis]|uniref:histidine kinase n=1 Tax=Tuwongella immobilis TaxID=692036 RepID=A0A6C2YK04_9BACT|nr:ATP-binding protein [Tuwongella immobilis]VIP01433.1 pas pac sensor hybrid histidine kinase : Signal transduction histidine kinase OS=Magnetospirillum magneticum (strain AMB-1 / ATCC 700264) GN=amb2165 PE=4 SV=1: PAS: HATPase_c [Tuwongella immobilis]VTR98391.1 pas pac sensor hybrid histidine kinase : Signal transduction histidine kinase OS=Magnetospirillum magneticum (strain AMB-1 / ATCC 700264) GN=amb2165 PE=4 SV=1: PAS: HATPase_c [Tuwongella immobilis]
MKVVILVAVEPEQAIVFRDKLRLLGHTVYTAGVADALRKAVEVSPTLALVDPNLTGPMDGIDLAQQLQQRQRLGIIFVGNPKTAEAFDRAESLKPLAYLHLPFDWASLAPFLELALLRHQRSRNLQIDQLRQMVFEQADLGIVATDVTGSITMMNPVAAALSGWDANDAIGQDYLKVLPTLHPETLAPIECQASRRAGEDLEQSGQPVVLLRRDGSHLPILVNLTAMTKTDRKMAGLVFAFRPDTATATIREATRLARQSRSLLDQFPVGYGTLNASGRLQELSPLASQLLGNGATLGRSLLDLVQPLDGPKVMEAFAAVINGQRTQTEGLIRAAGDPSVPVLLRLARLTADADRATIAVLVPLPADGLSDAPRERMRLLDALQRVLGQVAVRLNQSAVRLKGQSRLMLQHLNREIADPEAAAQYAEQITEGLTRQSQVLNQLTEFAGASVLMESELDLVDLLGSMRTELLELLGPANSLNLELPNSFPPIAADPRAVRNILTALAANARDALTAGGRWNLTLRRAKPGEWQADILPRLKPGEYIVLEASDTGAGISPEMQQRLFEPLVSTRGSSERLSGLGLAAAYGLMDRIGGGIAIQSTTGQGTTVRLYFPLWEYLPADRPVALIVEENRELRHQLAEWLRPMGYEPVPCRHASEALVSALPLMDRLQLLISQVPLPQTSCRELVQELESAQSGLRTIALASQPRDLLIYLGLIDPKWQIVAKPVQEAAFIDAVQRSLTQTPRR